MAKTFYKEDNEAIPAISYADSAPTGFTEITDATELKSLHVKKYEQRENDGVDYAREFTADLYQDIVSGTYTETEVFSLEQHLKYLMGNIKGGHWLTAQNTSTNLALSGIYDQTMKDAIQADIDTYITDNY